VDGFGEYRRHDPARTHRRDVFLAVPLGSGCSIIMFNKPPSGGFVVSRGT
jgi:hypothetical protein